MARKCGLANPIKPAWPHFPTSWPMKKPFSFPFPTGTPVVKQEKYPWVLNGNSSKRTFRNGATYINIKAMDGYSEDRNQIAP
jgi:hypothetical protein